MGRTPLEAAQTEMTLGKGTMRYQQIYQTFQRGLVRWAKVDAPANQKGEVAQVAAVIQEALDGIESAGLRFHRCLEKSHYSHDKPPIGAS